MSGSAGDWGAKIARAEGCLYTRPCGSCAYCAMEDYNARLVKRAPLDMPGTDAYFRSVMGSMRRETAGEPAARPSRKIPAPRVARSGAGAVFAGQKCYGCERAIRAGDADILAHVELPVVACAACLAGSSNARPREWSPVKVRKTPENAKPVDTRASA